jgi:site-specific DNA recombinase
MMQARTGQKEDENMDTNLKRVAIYGRVSSQEQATEGVSIEAQIATLQAYAKSQGWEIIDEYVDGGYSGGTDDRPALKRLLLDASQKRFNVIAVSKLDRFFRNLRLLLNYLHDLEQLGIKFVATQEGLDTSNPYGKFAVQIIGVIAEFERGRIGERVKDSRHYLIAQGNWAGGRPPYGYRWISRERRWEVVPEEAEVVQHIFDLYTRDKKGILLVAKTLNNEGIRTRDGALWRFSNVHKILTHPAYKGRHFTGIHMPVIIDEATWQQAQKRRADARSVRLNPKGWLLQGMCYCGNCGRLLKCMRKRPGERSYYACRGRVDRNFLDSSKRCTLPYIRGDWLERGVWQKVKDTLRDWETLTECVNKALAELEESKSRTGAEALVIDDKLEVIRTKKERLGLVFTDGAINENVYKSKLNQLKKQEADLLKCRHNIDPSELTRLSEMENRITMVKDILSKGMLSLTEFGIFGLIGDEYIPIGFNTWRECDGKLAIGEIAEMDTFPIEDTDMVMRGINAPAGFWECEDPGERNNLINRNLRAILQLFNVKVFVFPERIEIRGTIPTQFLDMPARKSSTASIITST